MNCFLRLARCPALGVLLAPSWGCSLIGAGIGNTIPRGADYEVPADIRAVPHDSKVTVVYFRPIDERGGGFLSMDGTYRGIRDERAVIERGENSFLIPVSRIREARYRPNTSSYWTEGLLVGLVVDLTVIAGTAWLASQPFRRGPGY